MRKKISFLLVMAMLMSLLPVTVFAENTHNVTFNMGTTGITVSAIEKLTKTENANIYTIAADTADATFTLDVNKANLGDKKLKVTATIGNKSELLAADNTNKYKLPAVTADATVKVEAVTAYAVTFSAMPEGIKVSAVDDLFDIGGTYYIAADTTASFTLDKTEASVGDDKVVKVTTAIAGGQASELKGTGDTYSLTGITGAVTVTVTIEDKDPVTYTVSGTVTPPANVSAKGITVTLSKAGETGQDVTATTDDNGAFTFNDVPAGTYTAKVAETNDYEAAEANVNVETANVANVAIELKAKTTTTTKPVKIECVVGNEADGTNWPDGQAKPTFSIKTEDGKECALTAVVVGTSYTVYAGDESIGVTFTVSDEGAVSITKGNAATATGDTIKVQYYTVTWTKTGASTGKITGTVGTDKIESGHAVLKGSTVTLTATESTTKDATFAWTGDITSAESEVTVTLSNKNVAVDCAITVGTTQKDPLSANITVQKDGQEWTDNPPLYFFTLAGQTDVVAATDLKVGNAYDIWVGTNTSTGKQTTVTIPAGDAASVEKTIDYYTVQVNATKDPETAESITGEPVIEITPEVNALYVIESGDNSYTVLKDTNVTVSVSGVTAAEGGSLKYQWNDGEPGTTASCAVGAVTAKQTVTCKITFVPGGSDASRDATLSSLTYTVDGKPGDIPDFTSANAGPYSVTLPAGTAANAVISLVATPTDTKAKITENKGVTLTDGKGTATIIVTAEDGESKQTYTVNFTVATKPVYTIKFAAGTGADGTMADKTVEKDASGATTVALPVGEAITFKAPAGKVFDKWTVNKVEGVTISADGKTLTIADTVDTKAEITVTATWKDAPTVTTPKYTIKFAAGEGATGTIADKTVDKADTGATTVALPVGEAFTFTAPEGKVFDKWVVDVEGVTVSENGETLTIDSKVSTTAAIVVTATWKVTGTTVAKPDVDTKELESAGVSKDHIEEVTESASTVKTTTESGTDPLADALNTQTEDVKALKESVTSEQKEAAVKELNDLEGVNVSSAADVQSVVVSYMDIKIREYVPGNGKLSMEIEPQLMVVLTSKAIADEVDKNNATIEVGKNAVKTDAKPRTAKISVPVKINLVFPSSFVDYVRNANKKVYAGHQTNRGRFEYRGELKSDGAFSFTNPHGFSPFDFPTDPSSGAWIGDVGYATLSSALEEVKNGDTIYVTGKDETGTTTRDNLTNAKFSIKKAESAESTDSATSWKGTVTINGTKYTTDANDTITVTKPDSKPDDKPGSTGGGGGGGSSKPAIKKGDQPEKPTTPTTTPGGGVAGFNDVATSAWYADSVKYVVDKGLFGGVGNGNFAPNANMTRAMMWTVLARYMGVNTNTGSSWYEAARTWAMAQNISDGTMADGNVTREQFVTMLWRLSGEPAVETSASFTDNGRISGYAKTAVDWAVAQGILNGYNDGSFRPQGSATRAEVAKMLTVFCQNVKLET